jgi:hypothetical protein
MTPGIQGAAQALDRSANIWMTWSISAKSRDYDRKRKTSEAMIYLARQTGHSPPASLC